MLQQALDAQLAAIDVGTRMAAAGDDLAVFIEADLDRTARRAVVARGVLPLLHVLDGNGDGLAMLAAEEHGQSRSGRGAGGLQRQRVQLFDVQVHHAGVHPDAELRRAALVRRLRATIVQADGPVVQRAGHAFAEHDALAQGAALVRAAVEQREYLVFGIAEHGHRAGTGALHAAGAEHRDVVDAADGFPVTHDSFLLVSQALALSRAYMPVTRSITC